LPAVQGGLGALKHKRDACLLVPKQRSLGTRVLLSLSRIPTPLFGLLAAEFPDDAALAEFAVEAGVGAGPARVQALLAVGNLHFLADDAGVPVRVMAAFIHKFHR